MPLAEVPEPRRSTKSPSKARGRGASSGPQAAADGGGPRSPSAGKRRGASKHKSDSKGDGAGANGVVPLPSSSCMGGGTTEGGGRGGGRDIEVPICFVMIAPCSCGHGVVHVCFLRPLLWCAPVEGKASSKATKKKHQQEASAAAVEGGDAQKVLLSYTCVSRRNRELNLAECLRSAQTPCLR